MTGRATGVRLAAFGLGAMTLRLGSIAQSKDQTMFQHAVGSFEVTMTPQNQSAGTDGAIPTARFGLEKTFNGTLPGKAVGTMLSIDSPKPGAAASYVALDQFSGTLAGKKGEFVLIHRGIMSKTGASDLDIRIATDSGTGDLAGIAGSLKIEMRDGKHCYDLSYTLP
jgi:hypothetical protein